MRLSPCEFHGSFVKPFGVWDSELVPCGNPFSGGPASPLKASVGQVDQLGYGIAWWEAAARFCDFADHLVQAFDGVAGVDDFAHRWRKLKERDDWHCCIN